MSEPALSIEEGENAYHSKAAKTVVFRGGVRYQFARIPVDRIDEAWLFV